VTLSVLALRLTVFSDMVTSVPAETVNSMVESEGNYKINSKPVFATASSKGDVFISNAESNSYWINVDITLEEDGQSILTSGFIKPGDSTVSAKLNPLGQQLEDGLYPCIAEITAHDPDSLKPVGSAKENIIVQIGESTDESPDADTDAEDEDSTDSDVSEESTDSDTSEDSSSDDTGSDSDEIEVETEESTDESEE
jgi:hypothetical protein